MPSPSVLDLSTLLTPIAGGDGAGTNLRDVAANPAGRAIYDTIRGLRNQARLKEKPQMMGDPTAPAGPPDEWRSILEKTTSAITGNSKDLELVTYLIEAALRIYGYAGLRDGFSLYRGMVEQFWDTLYPPLGDDGVAGRVSGLASLNGDSSRDGALLFPLSRVPLTDGNGASFGLFHYVIAITLDKLPPERQEERVKAGQANLKMFEDSAKRSPAAFRKNLSEDLTQCIEEFDKLNAVLTEKCGQDAPPSSKIREVLERCLQIVTTVGGPIPEPAAASGAGETGKSATSSSQERGAVMEVPGTFRNRDEAFEVVLRVATFFRETEPQSPVIFALEQAVRWGKMKLPDLLSELITDESARRNMFQLVGIRPPSDGNG